MPVRYVFVVAIIALLSTPVFSAEGVKIGDLVVAAPLSEPQATINLNAVRAFYDFWNTGDGRTKITSSGRAASPRRFRSTTSA
jgi:hypothetical protein